MVASVAMSYGQFSLKSENRIYLDHNATAPLAQDLPGQVQEWLKEWGNPSSIHFQGRGPKTLIREARQNLAQMLGVDSLELIMTSGGSEANNLALKGVFDAYSFSQTKGRRIIDRPRFLVSAVEHPSVRKTLDFLSQKGARVEVIPVDRNGCLDIEAYAGLLDDQVALVSVMYASNETGHIFPINKMAKMAHEHGALFHCDAVQALGKVPLNLRKLEVDLASFSGHKFYSLKGSGILYSRKGIFLESQIHGGGQERGRRAGTENVLASAALGWMCQFQNQIETRAGEMKKLRDYIEARLIDEISDLRVLGQKAKRLPNTTCALISGVDGETLLMNLDIMGVSVSTGAACSSGNTEPSPTLLAMGLNREEAQSSLRISMGWGTTQDELDKFIVILKETVLRLRGLRNDRLREKYV